MAYYGAMVNACSVNGANGNPSYVVLVEEVLESAKHEYLSLAQQFACEVTVISGAGDAPVLSFFAPSGEIGFCGHGTLAAAAWLDSLQAGSVSERLFQTQNGGIAVQRDKDGYYSYLQQAYGVQQYEDPAVVRQLTLVLGVDCLQVLISRGALREKLIIEVADKTALAAIEVKPELRDALCADTQTTGLYVYARGPVEQDGLVVFARYFPAGWGELEDMATASIAPTVIQPLCSTPENGLVLIKQGGPECDQAQLVVAHTENSDTWIVKGQCTVSMATQISVKPL